MLPSLHFLFRVLAKDARRADQEHENQDGESAASRNVEEMKPETNASTTPRIRPPTTAPGRMPIPPSTAATKALSLA